MRSTRLTVFVVFFLFALQSRAIAQNENEPRLMPSPGSYGVGFTRPICMTIHGDPPRKLILHRSQLEDVSRCLNGIRPTKAETI
jgi:hypothetical protein